MTVIEREQTEVVTEVERRARILEAAALEIEVRGWTQGAALDCETGAVCALGAAMYSLGGNPDNFFDRGAFYARFGQVWGGDIASAVVGAGPPHYAISQWNDRTAKSAEEVTFLLRWRASEIRSGR